MAALPIRVGIIGMSAESSWSTTAHLPYLKDSSQFEIVAVCNSSVESSQRAIKAHGLSALTKAYGNPEDIAKDPNVQLVVCTVRVDRHNATITPSLKAGKDIYVEWPLGKNLADAEDLLRKRKESGAKTAVVGLQARHAPIVQKLKDLIKENRIGKVLSSTWVGAASNGGQSETIEYLTQDEVGGNIVTIHFGHSVDYIQQVLGSKFESSHSLLANRRPVITLLNADGSVADKAHKKTAMDQIMVHGTLENSGVVVSINLRGGRPFKNTPGNDWRIYGETGEIRVTSAGPFLQIGYPDMKIAVHDFATDSVEEVEIPTDDFDKYPLASRNVARVYNAIATGNLDLCCDFADAVERHRFIDGMYKQNL